MIVIPLLGISAKPHIVIQKMWGARRFLESSAAQQAPAQAAYALAQVAELLPWRTELWEGAGIYAMQGGDPQSAQEYLGKAASQGQLSPAGRLALGDVYLQEGDLKAAVNEWEGALESADNHGDIYARLLSAHLVLGDSQAAIRDLQSMVLLEPADAHLHYQLGLLLASQRPEEALPHLALAGELDPDLADPAESLAFNIRAASLKEDPAYTLVEAGRLLSALDEWNLANEAFRQAILIRPEYAEAWAFLGEARQHLPDGVGDSDGLPELSRALELDPKSLSAHLFLALYWQRQDRLDLAQDYLEAVSEFYPDQPELQVELGRTLALQGDLESALKAYQNAVHLAPEESTYYGLLAAFSLEHDYFVNEVALPAARRVVLLSPNDPSSLDLMGMVFYQLGDVSSAERFFLGAVRYDPDYAPAHLHLGQVYLLKEDHPSARGELQLVLSLAPDTPEADHARRLLEDFFP